MTASERLLIIQERLRQQFQPILLDVIDDSHKHIGHAGSRDGAGHYTVVIKADCFRQKTRIEVHREIYALLNDLIPHEIHALQIKLMN